MLARGEVPSLRELEDALAGFRGNILQSPPAYSAIHINGRRSHELAREGKSPKMKKRPVTVHSLELLSWAPPVAEIRALVSPGTYIRSLARDIALAAGSRAHLAALKRTGVGPFSLDEAVTVQDKASGPAETDLVKHLRPLDRKLFESLSIPVLFVEDHKNFIQGKPLEKLFTREDLCFQHIEGVSPEMAGVFCKNAPGDFLGYLNRRQGKWSYGHVHANN